MTPTTTLPRDPPIRSDYELDEVDSRNLIRTWEAANERDERRNRRKIVGLIKDRAWDLAAARCTPGRA